MVQSTRLRNLSPFLRLSTATMSSSPRWLSALIRLEPMKPAAPVTTIILQASLSREQLFGVHDRGAELADHDAGRLVRPTHGLFDIAAGRQHGAEDRDHRISRTAHVVD